MNGRIYGSLATATLLVFIACGGGEQQAEQAEETTPAGQEAQAQDARATGEAVGETTGGEAMAEAAAGESGAEAGAASEAEAPGPGVEQPTMKHWMTIEFARAVSDADLQWLQENGFHVDTVMSETLVRGWLENLAAGEVLGADPRIANIDAQMR